jgi:hypothetical protein
MHRFPILLAVLLTFSAPMILGQEEEKESEQDRDILDVDTCGTLAGKLVTYTARTEVSWSGHPGHEAIEVKHSIAMGRYPDLSELLTWTSEEHPDDIKPFKVKAKKKDLKIYTKDENRLVAHFIPADNWNLLMPVYRTLLFAPAFRKRIEKSLETKDTALSWYGLQEILPAVREMDAHVAQVVELVILRGDIQRGDLDPAINRLHEVLDSPVDDTINRYGKQLMDSANDLKRASQPAVLAEARKIGKLPAAPFYPPLDSPTVFWRDKVLCVVQEDKQATARMRSYDPQSGKWGKAVAVKFQETGVSRLHNLPKWGSGTADGQCLFCWPNSSGTVDDLDCHAMTCASSLLLDIPGGGSVDSMEHLKRAGGTPAMGNSQYQFRDEGALYPLGNANVSWNLFPEGLRFQTRHPFLNWDLSRPVVVSPDQDWVAYALEAKDGKGVELWVGRLKYNPDVLVR